MNRTGRAGLRRDDVGREPNDVKQAIPRPSEVQDEVPDLDKRKFKVEELVPHIRILALRRALSFANEALMGRVQEIAETSATVGEAVEHFCKEVLAVAMTRLVPSTAKPLAIKAREPSVA